MTFLTVADAESTVRRSLEAGPAQGLERLRRTLAGLVAGTGLRSLVRAALDDDAALEAIARRSYAHANGFDKVVLLSSGEPEFELRLHVWWPDERGGASRAPELRIHNHRWDYASHLVSGRLRFAGFDVTEDDDGRPMYEHAYRPLRGGDLVDLLPLGTARLRCAFDGEMPPGTTYALSYRIPHHVASDRRGLAATLVLRGPTRVAETRVYLERPLGTNPPAPVRPFDRSDVAARLRRFHAHLEGT